MLETKPALITTTKGLMAFEQLEQRTGRIDDANETTDWVEYWHDGELVHRSVAVVLKPVIAQSSVQEL